MVLIMKMRNRYHEHDLNKVAKDKNLMQHLVLIDLLNDKANGQAIGCWTYKSQRLTFKLET